jgi:hypothetical protein
VGDNTRQLGLRTEHWRVGELKSSTGEERTNKLGSRNVFEKRSNEFWMDLDGLGMACFALCFLEDEKRLAGLKKEISVPDCLVMCAASHFQSPPSRCYSTTCT